MSRVESQIGCDLSHPLGCPNLSLPFPVRLALLKRSSCLQDSPRSLRSIFPKFLSDPSQLSIVHTWSKFLWPSTFDPSYSQALPLMTPTQLPQAGSHSPYIHYPLLCSLVGAISSVKNTLCTKVLYYSAQILFPTLSLLLPLQEIVLQCLNISYILLRLPLSNALYWVNLFLILFWQCFVEILEINKENDKIKNNFWPCASNHDIE